jgi:hypothetical protein
MQRRSNGTPRKGLSMQQYQAKYVSSVITCMNLQTEFLKNAGTGISTLKI